MPEVFWMRRSALRLLLVMILCAVVCICTPAQEPVSTQPASSLQAVGTEGSGAVIHDAVAVAIVPVADDPIAFTVHVDGRELAWTPATDTVPRRTEVSLLVTTFDKKNKELNRDANVITASAPKTDPPTGRLIRNIDFPYKLDFNPRAVRARFVVRVTSTGRVGSVETALQQIIVPPLPPAPATP